MAEPKNYVIYIKKTDRAESKWWTSTVVFPNTADNIKKDMKQDGTLEQYVFFDVTEQTDRPKQSDELKDCVCVCECNVETTNLWTDKDGDDWPMCKPCASNTCGKRDVI